MAKTLEYPVKFSEADFVLDLSKKIRGDSTCGPISAEESKRFADYQLARMKKEGDIAIFGMKKEGNMAAYKGLLKLCFKKHEEDLIAIVSTGSPF